MDRSVEAMKAFDFLTWAPSSSMAFGGIEVDCASHFHCTGYARSQGRRCHNPVNAANRARVVELIRRVMSCYLDSTDVSAWLREAATLSLCVRWHRDQAGDIERRWRRILGLPSSGSTVRLQTTTEVTEMPDSPTPISRRLAALPHSAGILVKRETVETLTAVMSTALVKRDVDEVPTNALRAIGSSASASSTIVAKSGHIETPARASVASGASTSTIPTCETHQPFLAPQPAPLSTSPEVDLYSASSASSSDNEDDEDEDNSAPSPATAPSPASSTTSTPDAKTTHEVLRLLPFPPSPSEPSSSSSPSPKRSDSPSLPASPLKSTRSSPVYPFTFTLSSPVTQETATQTTPSTPSTSAANAATALEALQPHLVQLIQSITQLTAVLSAATTPPSQRHSTPLQFTSPQSALSPLTPPRFGASQSTPPPTTPTRTRPRPHPQYRLTAPLTPPTPSTHLRSSSIPISLRFKAQHGGKPPTPPTTPHRTTQTQAQAQAQPQTPTPNPNRNQTQTFLRTPLELTPPRTTTQHHPTPSNFVHAPLPLTPPRPQSQIRARVQSHTESPAQQEVHEQSQHQPVPVPPTSAMTFDAELVNHVAAAVVVALGMVQERALPRMSSLGQRQSDIAAAAG